MNPKYGPLPIRFGPSPWNLRERPKSEIFTFCTTAGTFFRAWFSAEPKTEPCPTAQNLIPVPSPNENFYPRLRACLAPPLYLSPPKLIAQPELRSGPKNVHRLPAPEIRPPIKLAWCFLLYRSLSSEQLFKAQNRSGLLLPCPRIPR